MLQIHFHLNICTCGQRESDEGCGFFSWFDGPNETDQVGSLARRVQILEARIIGLQLKVEALELKNDALDIGSSLCFCNGFGCAMKACFVIILCCLIMYMFKGSSTSVTLS